MLTRLFSGYCLIQRLQERLGHRDRCHVVLYLPEETVPLCEQFAPQSDKLRLEFVFKPMVTSEEQDELLDVIKTGSRDPVFYRMRTASPGPGTMQSCFWRLPLATAM